MGPSQDILSRPPGGGREFQLAMKKAFLLASESPDHFHGGVILSPRAGPAAAACRPMVAGEAFEEGAEGPWISIRTRFGAGWIEGRSWAQLRSVYEQPPPHRQWLKMLFRRERSAFSNKVFGSHAGSTSACEVGRVQNRD